MNELGLFKESARIWFVVQKDGMVWCIEKNGETYDEELSHRLSSFHSRLI